MSWNGWGLSAHLAPGEPAPSAACADALALAGFCALLATLIAGGDGYHAFFDALNAPWARLPDAFGETVTYAGDTLSALALMLLVARLQPRVVWLGTLGALVASVISNAVKPAVAALRPAAVLPTGSFHLLGPVYTAHSFPSGHSITAFATAATLGWHLRSRVARVALYLMAALVAWSRVGVGAHWPVDTLAGAAIGSASVAFAAPIARRWTWGDRAPGHALLLLGLAGCAGWLALRTPVYPLAAWPAHVLAWLALAVFAAGWWRNRHAGATAAM